ncbi:MAG: 4-demethylwyosine synthase TYW1 [bacterium]|nr:4-demethylwyosine synthase TYW1 [bacterium]
MLTKEKTLDLEKQGYRMVGNHSSIKVCLWTKKVLRGQDACYKNQFYGIHTWRCVQMSPSMVCSQRCVWCWRDIDFTLPKWSGPIDDPKEIIDGCIKEHVKYIRGFGGNKNVDKVRYFQAMAPKHFAISLISEPTFYPKLPELIDELHKRNMTSFLVTNANNPDMLEKLLKHPPTQLYITLPAPDEATYKKACKPVLKDGWQRIMDSIDLLKKFKCRKAVRMTLVKDVNMIKPEKYAEILNNAAADFFELKAYMYVGHSKKRLQMSNMPLHPEIIDFSKKLAKHTSLKLIDQKEESRVALMMKKDSKDRIMKF